MCSAGENKTARFVAALQKKEMLQKSNISQ